MIYITVKTELETHHYESDFFNYITPQRHYALHLDLVTVQQDFIGSIADHITFSNNRPNRRF